MATDDTISVQVVADTRQAITNLADFAARAIGLTNDLARMAHEAQETQNAINSLGAAYTAVQSSTAGAVSASQAFRMQQQLQEAGVNVSSDAMGVLTRRARDYANATNTDLGTALDRVTNAITTGSAPALQRLGVHLEHNARGGRASAEALRQWRTQQSGAAPEAQNLAEAADANARAWREFTNSMAATAAQAINLRGILASLREATGGLGEAIRNGLAEVGIGAGGEETQRRNTERQTEQLRLQIAEDAARRGAGRIAGLDRLTVAQLYATRDRLARGENPNAVVGEASGQGRAAIAADQAAAAAARTAPDITGVRDGGRGGGANALRDATRAAAELRRNAAAAGMLDDVDPMIERRPGERAASWKRRLDLLAPGIQQAIQEEVASRAAERQAAQTRQQRDEAHTAAMAPLRAAENAAAEAQRATQARGQAIDRLSGEGQMVLDQRIRGGARLSDELIEETRRATNAGEQFNATFQRIFGETQTAAQHAASLVGGAFSTMTNSFKSHLGAMIEGRETVGEAMRGIAHETLLSLAQEAAVKAVMQTAEGLANLARWNFPGAAQNFAAAGAYGGVAVLAGIGAAATNPPAQTASGASGGAAHDRGPASTSARGAGAERGMGTVIHVNFNGAPIHTLEEVHDTVASAANIGRTRGAMLDVETLDRRRRAG